MAHLGAFLAPGTPGRSSYLGGDPPWNPPGTPLGHPPGVERVGRGFATITTVFDFLLFGESRESFATITTMFDFLLFRAATATTTTTTRGQTEKPLPHAEGSADFLRATRAPVPVGSLRLTSDLH